MTRYEISMLMLIIGSAVLSSALSAAQMTFSGTLNDPPQCTINNDKPVIVDFGNSIGVNKVDGNHYRKTLDYQFTCEPNSPQTGLALVLLVGSSGQSSFDTAAINASSPGLGVHLIVDGQSVVFGQTYPAAISSPPLIEAVPVKDKNVSLTEGPFTATATLQVAYQ